MKKGGFITRGEKDKQRKKDLAAAEKAQHNNEGKVKYYLDQRSYLLLTQEQIDDKDYMEKIKRIYK